MKIPPERLNVKFELTEEKEKESEKNQWLEDKQIEIIQPKEQREDERMKKIKINRTSETCMTVSISPR